MAALSLAGQRVDAEDAADGVVAERQRELGDEAAGAEAGSFLPEGDDLLFERGLGFVRTRMRGAAVGVQPVEVLLVVTAQPLADSVARTTEVGGGGAQAVLEGVEHEVVTQGELGIGGADHGVVGRGVGVGRGHAEGESTVRRRSRVGVDDPPPSRPPARRPLPPGRRAGGRDGAAAAWVLRTQRRN